MIAAIISEPTHAEPIINSIQYLATALGKQATVAIIATTTHEFDTAKKTIEEILTISNFTDCKLFKIIKIQETTEFCETNEISFLLLQLFNANSKNIQKGLNACRELRIPYLFLKENQELTVLNKVLVPVNFLEEELEKAQFASAFGRFCNSEIELLQANDYGRKAANNTARMIDLFAKFNLQVTLTKAKRDSFKVDFEAIALANETQTNIILITASREYGLDDIIFGPREQKLIKKSATPLLLINPRGDLYTLCD